MLLAASESAVTKKPRLRLTTRRSSSVSPFGSFHSCDVAAHVDFLRHPVVGAGGDVLLPGPLVLEGHQLVDVGLGVDDLLVLDRDAAERVVRPAAPRASPGLRRARARWSGLRKSSMWVSVVLGGTRSGLSVLEFRPVLAQQRAQAASRSPRWSRHLAGRDVQVPLGADDGHPLAVLRVLLQQLGRARSAASPNSSARNVSRRQPGAMTAYRPARLRRRPQRRQERPGEAAAAESDHWQASQSGLSMAHIFGRLGLSVGTAFSSPAFDGRLLGVGGAHARAGSRWSSGRGSRRACRSRRASCPRRPPCRC